MARPSVLQHISDGELASGSRKQDLRASVRARLSRGSSIRYSRTFALVLLDSTLLILARRLAEIYGTPWNPFWNTKENISLIVFVVTLELGLIAARGLYKAGNHRRDYIGIIKALSLGNCLILLTAFLYYPSQLISRSTFILSWLLSVLFVCVGRAVMDYAIKQARHRGVVRHPVFAFCHSEDAEKIAALLEQEEYYRFAGWEDISSIDHGILASTLNQISGMGISEVFVCSRSPIQSPMYLYWMLRNAGITLHFLSVGLDPLFRESEFSTIGGVPCIKFSPPAISGIDFKVKRIFDFCFAIFVLLLGFPIYLLLSVLIKLDSPGPIFYRQTRIGLHSQPIKIWKFRTMVPNADQLQKQLETQNQTKDGILFKIKDDPRITRVGRFLRRYSLDELPQVFNVLFGEMSFVGPRPFPLRDVEKFSERHFIRHEVLPGITGLWQVSGRSDIDNFEDVLRLDIRYIENWSLWLDLKIILKTFKVILRKTGAY
ncbi:MAG: sugar transferase [Cyanobacteria bacterium RM1_2_2]|nr:sugar transferase [Cyanobacteria bacterium RM1_2_2]